jgi:hypothetical protein
MKRQRKIWEQYRSENLERLCEKQSPSDRSLARARIREADAVLANLQKPGTERED